MTNKKEILARPLCSLLVHEARSRVGFPGVSPAAQPPKARLLTEPREPGPRGPRAAAQSSTKHLHLGRSASGSRGSRAQCAAEEGEDRKWPSDLFLLGVQGGTCPHTHQEVGFLGRIIGSASSAEKLRPTEKKGLSVPRMLVPRPVLCLSVLEEMQDPFVGPVPGSCNWSIDLSFLCPGRLQQNL